MSAAPIQIVLPLGDLDRSLLVAVRIRIALRAVGDVVGLKAIGVAWGIGAEDPAIESKVSQILSEKDRHWIRLSQILAVMALDSDGIVIATLCESYGFERPERKVEPASDEQRELAALRQLVGPEVVDLARRKAGL